MEKKEINQFTMMLKKNRFEIINQQIDFEDQQIKVTLTTKPTETIIKHVDSQKRIIAERKNINKIILCNMTTVNIFNDKETSESMNESFPLQQLEQIIRI